MGKRMKYGGFRGCLCFFDEKTGPPTPLGLQAEDKKITQSPIAEEKNSAIVEMAEEYGCGVIPSSHVNLAFQHVLAQGSNFDAYHSD